MCGEVALRNIPKRIIAKYGLVEALAMRDEVERPEVAFAFRDLQPRLPILVDGKVSVLE